MIRDVVFTRSMRRSVASVCVVRVCAQRFCSDEIKYVRSTTRPCRKNCDTVRNLGWELYKLIKRRLLKTPYIDKLEFQIFFSAWQRLQFLMPNQNSTRFIFRCIVGEQLC